MHGLDHSNPIVQELLAAHSQSLSVIKAQKAKQQKFAVIATLPKVKSVFKPKDA